MIKITKIKNVKTPERGHPTDAGLDFFIPDDCPDNLLCIFPGEKITIASGIKMVIPTGFAGIFKNKSSIGSRGLILGPCVVDSSYRGEIDIVIWNISNNAQYLNRGQKVTQMLVQKVELDEVEEITNDVYNLHTTERGTGGFGSTGE